MKLTQLIRDSEGFAGHFEFVPEHSEDQGVGNICDWVNVGDELVYVDVEDEKHLISDCLEEHVAEPIARMLNAMPELLKIAAAALAWHVDPRTKTICSADDNLHKVIDSVLGSAE